MAHVDSSSRSTQTSNSLVTNIKFPINRFLTTIFISDLTLRPKGGELDGRALSTNPSVQVLMLGPGSK